jgi:hypothetical protein
LRADHARLVDDIVTLTEIPAPPFGEEARGRAMAAMMRAAACPMRQSTASATSSPRAGARRPRLRR